MLYKEIKEENCHIQLKTDDAHINISENYIWLIKLWDSQLSSKAFFYWQGTCFLLNSKLDWNTIPSNSGFCIVNIPKAIRSCFTWQYLNETCRLDSVFNYNLALYPDGNRKNWLTKHESIKLKLRIVLLKCIIITPIITYHKYDIIPNTIHNKNKRNIKRK